jgi:predicted ArsR family transcriptional regulator
MHFQPCTGYLRAGSGDGAAAMVIVHSNGGTDDADEVLEVTDVISEGGIIPSFEKASRGSRQLTGRHCSAVTAAYMPACQHAASIVWANKPGLSNI